MADLGAQSRLADVGHPIGSFCQKRKSMVAELNDRLWVV